MRLDTVSKNILLFGATGYIGGTVLSRLIAHPKSDTFRITVLVRSPEKTKLLKQLGLKVAVGSLDDVGLIKSLASEADIIFQCADSDHLPAARAILTGIKHRYQSTGKRSCLIQTSGTGVLMDDANGMYATNNVYSDLDLKKIESIPLSQPHRNVDVEIVQADEEGYMYSYIVLPSTIYGIASTPLVDMGIQNSRSQQIPGLVRICIQRGQAGMIGLGKNMWPNVHIDELGDLFMLLLDVILDGDAEEIGHGRSGYYFAENGEHEMAQIASRIGQELYALGKAKSPIPKTFDEKEMKKYFANGSSLGTNSRCIAERSRGLGWEPVLTTKDMLESIREEIEGELTSR